MEPLYRSFTLPDSRSIKYWEWGEENTKVIFCVHGMTRNGRDFDFLAQHLRKNYRVICPDVAGRGKSDWLTDKTQYHNFTYAADLIRLINSLKITHLDWIGTSMGGLIGMLIAAAKKDMIGKMVINDIGPFVPKEALRRIAEYTGKNTPLFNWESAKRYFREIYAPWGLTSDEQIDQMMKYSLNKTDKGYIVNNDPGIGQPFRDEKGEILDLSDLDLWEVWEKINAKVLLLRGEKSDLLPADVAKKMTETGPKAKLIEIPGVGHCPSLMEEEHVKIVEEFLEMSS